MRLRRSDFMLWDYPKRSTWRVIRGNRVDLSWALGRANSRGMYALIERRSIADVVKALADIAEQMERTSHPVFQAQSVSLFQRIGRMLNPEFRQAIQEAFGTC